ncbi:arylsulfatase [Sinorhizobium fredii]|uniref:Arylsulfatase n=1 Tax=Rhizobium fredii TaxID=380 RepID=A0A2A6LQ70_RHIFR|nr:arylsulfatase [Sinorhizobium fredii]PDT44366.1 arylsulfatase [Sinorhizobium fredii]
MKWLRLWRRTRDALAIGSCLIAQSLLVGTAFAQQTKPNILFILADNVGYGDIGVYGGGELRGSPTPRIDQLAAEGLRLTQFLVEPSCTPSRAALMTGRYSIRSGLSLVAVAGTPFSLPAEEITMAEMLRDAGYATAMFGKWHLGAQAYSQPQNQGFDEFYGIPPGDTWDAFGMIRQGRQTKSVDIPLDKGPQIVEAKRGEPLKLVKPYTEEVRRGIDWELVDHGVDFMTRQKATGKPFFLYLPISRTHFPNLPSKRFEGASRVGQFGDSLMEGDAIVGAMLDALKELGLEDDTLVVFASDNGPDGPGASRYGTDMPDMGTTGPYRGALGDVSEGAIRTAAVIRWPQRIRARSSNAMFSVMDFFPTLARLAGGKVPGDRPIDGIDQSDLLFGENDSGRREHLLTFVGSDLVAVRWKQFRAYFVDVAAGRSGPGGATLMGGVGSSAAPMNGYPKVFNIEADPQEEHNIGEMYNWVLGPLLKAVEDYKATLVRAPNPPAANMTRF